MERENTDRRAFLLLGLVMLLWAGNSIVARAVRFDVPPLALALGRWTFASLLLVPFAIPALRRDWPALLRGWKIVLALGLLGVGCFNALLYTGLRYTTATNALLLQAAIPALVLLFERLLFGTRAGRLQLCATALSMVGVCVVVFQGDPAHVLAMHFGFGDVLILITVVIWALYTVLLRLRPQTSKPISFIFATFVIGVIALAPFAVWEWSQGERVHATWAAAGGLAYVSIFPSIISYFIYNSAAAKVGAARAGQAITLMPVFGAFLSAALLGEQLHPYHFAGIALIVGGIVIGALALARESATRKVFAETLRTGPPPGAPLEDRA